MICRPPILAFVALMACSTLAPGQSVVLVLTNDMTQTDASSAPASFRSHGFALHPADGDAGGRLWMRKDGVGGLWIFRSQDAGSHRYFQLVDGIRGVDVDWWRLPDGDLSSSSIAQCVSNALKRIAVGPAVTPREHIGVRVPESQVAVTRLRGLIVKHPDLTLATDRDNLKAALRLQDSCGAGRLQVSFPYMGRMLPSSFVLTVDRPYSCRLVASEIGRTVARKSFAPGQEEAVVEWLAEHARGHVR